MINYREKFLDKTQSYFVMNEQCVNEYPKTTSSTTLKINFSFTSPEKMFYRQKNYIARFEHTKRRFKKF